MILRKFNLIKSSQLERKDRQQNSVSRSTTEVLKACSVEKLQQFSQKINKTNEVLQAQISPKPHKSKPDKTKKSPKNHQVTSLDKQEIKIILLNHSQASVLPKLVLLKI